jgi:hypothetical protein
MRTMFLGKQVFTGRELKWICQVWIVSGRYAKARLWMSNYESDLAQCESSRSCNRAFHPVL